MVYRRIASLLVLLVGVAAMWLLPNGEMSAHGALAQSDSFAQSLGQVVMVTPSGGWAFSAHGVVRTTTGGASWKVASPPGLTKRRYGPCFHLFGFNGAALNGAYSLSATDARHAWLAVTCDKSVNDATRQLTIFRTTDAGREWRSVIVHLGVQDEDPPVILTHFANPDVGWLVTESRSVTGPPGATGMFETRSRGAHWTQTALHLQAPEIIGFQANTRVYAATNALQHTWVDFAHFPYISSDAGRTWVHAAAPVPAAYRAAELSFGTAGFSGTASAAIPVSLSLAQPKSSPVCTTYHTSNGGSTWWHTSLIRFPCKVYFFNARDGWAMNSEGNKTVLYRTTDGGKHWTSLGTVHFWENQFYFISQRDGFAVGGLQGHYGLLRSSDAGKTWTLIEPQLVPK